MDEHAVNYDAEDELSSL
jgi:hypothetical protein